MRRREFIQSTAMGAMIIPEAISDVFGATGLPGNTKIKVGQIGVCHEHAGGRMDTIRKLPDLFDVVGVVDDRNSKAARFAGDDLKPYEGLTWLTEEELFSVPDLQAVLVETANGDLVPTGIRCMRRQLGISMDKPGGEDLKQFKYLLDGCQRQNLPFQIAYMFRGNPAFNFAKMAVQKGWLGDVFDIKGGMSHSYGGEVYQHYLSNYKGGIMFNLGCHFVDFIVSLMGRPTDVTSLLSTTKGAVKGSKNNAVSVIQYPTALATIHACDSEVKGSVKRRLRICGSNGTIDLCPLEKFQGGPFLLELTLQEGNEVYSKGTHFVEFPIQRDRYDVQLTEFAQMVSGQVKSPYTFDHDYLTQQVHLAASGYLKFKDI